MGPINKEDKAMVGVLFIFMLVMSLAINAIEKTIYNYNNRNEVINRNELSDEPVLSESE